jgi:NAD dependent epimerase/dehydratase
MADFWKGRAVLVTGAGGFIGSHLCQRLVQLGASVRALIHYDARAHRSNLEFLPRAELNALEVVAGDVCDPFFVRHIVKGRDTVFHLAALIAIPYSYVAPQSYVRVNVEGTLNVAEACRSEGTRCLVHTSTSETYGTAQYTPIDENHPMQGQSPYSASKIGADKMLESYVRSFELPAVTLRPFNTYGPRQSARAVIPTIISQCLSPEISEITLGDTSPVRDFNFVGDTVDAFLAAGSHDNCFGQTLNAGSGKGVTIGEVLSMIQRITGVNKPLKEDARRIRPAQSEVFKLVADAARLMQLTGWQPACPLEQGLAASVEFVRSHPELFLPDNYAI